jgi:hypothetical protein
MDDMSVAISGWVIAAAIVSVVVMAAMYFLPTMIAIVRDHRQILAIATFNVLLGWTMFGWVWALVWSLTQPPPARIVVMPQPSPPPPST